MTAGVWLSFEPYVTQVYWAFYCVLSIVYCLCLSVSVSLGLCLSVFLCRLWTLVNHTQLICTNAECSSWWL